MPSRAYTSFLPNKPVKITDAKSGVNALSGLYLISTQVLSGVFNNQTCVNALSGLYLISTVPLQKPRFYAVSRACFCKYSSEYSDRSSFSCMFTIWTHLTHQIFPNPEFTIAQNYSSVILFFHQNYRRTHSLILYLTLVRNILRQHLHPLPMDYNKVIAYGMLVDL